MKLTPEQIEALIQAQATRIAELEEQLQPAKPVEDGVVSVNEADELQIMRVLYMVGRRTNHNSNTKRHIDNEGKPLCEQTAFSGKNKGSGWVQDNDIPTCKDCIKIWIESQK